MKHKTKNNKTRSVFVASLLPILGVTVLAFVASSMPGVSRAATSFKNAPVGVADYCRLEGSTTVIYGWAHDSQAGATNNPWVTVTVGGTTVRVATSIDGYRDKQINTYLQDNNYKTASRYGFKASFTGKYKGTSPAISGRIENVGEGSNQALRVNTASPISSGPPDKYYFSGNRVPDACLPAAPVVSTPSTGTTTPTTTPSTPTSTPQSSTPTKVTPPRSSTPTTNTTPTTQTTLPKPETVAASYSLALSLIDEDRKLSDVLITLNGADKAVTTDENGIALFTDLTTKEYTAAFTIGGRNYEQLITLSDTELATTKIDKQINVADLSPVNEQTAESDTEAAAVTEVSNSKTPLIIAIVLSIIVLIVGILLVLRKRTTSTTHLHPVPRPRSTVAPATQATLQSPVTASHAGVSLKDLVLESMREEAARRNAPRS